MSARFGMARRTILVVVVLLSLRPASLIGQGPALAPPGNPFSMFPQAGGADWQFGFQLFQLLLEQKGLRTESSYRNAINQRPRQTVIVLLSEVPRTSPFWSPLRRFVDRGGVAVIASDQGVFGTGFVIEDSQVTVMDDAEAYDGYSDCLRVSDLQHSHPVLQGVDQLIANRSSWISHMGSREGSWDVLAKLPTSARDSRGWCNGKPLIAEMKSHRDRNGRLLLMADHSLLINGMLWHGDNARLATNLVDWLTEDDRTRIFIGVDGQSLDPIVAQPPLPTPEELPPPTLEDLAKLPKETLLKFANRFVTGLEDADVLNELVAGQPAELERPLYRQALYLSAAFMAAFQIVRLMGRAGQRLERPPHRASGVVTAAAAPQALSSTQLRPAAKELARDLFRQLSGSSDPQSWTVSADDVEVDGHFLHRHAVRRRLQKFRSLASSAYRSSVSRRDLKHMAKQIERLLALHRQGKLRHPWFDA